MRTVLFLMLAATTAFADAPREDDLGRVSYTAPMTKPAPKAEWVELATPTPARNGTEYVLIGKEAGRFARLRLDATGDVYVYRVQVRYTDGKTTTIALGRRISKSTTLDVGDRAIDSVIVTTDTAGKGSYSVFGASGSGGVALR